jgi:hypothetical protein
MPKFYILFCAVLVAALAYAGARGVVYSSYLPGSGAQKAASHQHK